MCVILKKISLSFFSAHRRRCRTRVRPRRHHDPLSADHGEGLQVKEITAPAEAMANFAKDLMGGQGCSVDGLAQARNPMGQFVDSIFQGPQGAKGQAVGPRGALTGPAASMHAAMKSGFQGPQAQPRVRNPQNWGANFQPPSMGPAPRPIQRSVRAKSAVAQNWGAEFAPTANARQANILRRASLNGPRGANPIQQMHQSMMMQQNARAQQSMMMQSSMMFAQQQQVMMSQVCTYERSLES